MILGKERLLNCEIICVGTELLLGHTIDTNSGYLAQQLAGLGISSYRQVVVGDNPERLFQQIQESAESTDLIILTGGLGPTLDDITMKVAAEVAQKPLVLHQPSLDKLITFFAKINQPMTDNNLKQAMLPLDAIILENTCGTAPGALFSYERDSSALDIKSTSSVPLHTLIALLPGPPKEMKAMFELALKPILQTLTPYRLKTEYIKLFGIGESRAEAEIEDLIRNQTNPTIAPYAAEGECMFRVTQRIEKDTDPDLLTPTIEKIKTRLKDFIYEIGPRSMKEVVYDLLLQKNLTLSLAESCSVGLLASELGELDGLSQVFMGSVVSYGNKAKMDILGVDPEIIEQDGAVSANCARAMAKGALHIFQTDLALSITGIAGPSGGSDLKPVGLVYVAIADKNDTIVRELKLSGNRNRIRYVAVLHALNMIREFLK